MRAFLFLSFALFLTSCGESFVDITARHQAEYDSLKKELALIAEKIPETFAEVSPETPLDPLPEFDPYSPDTNTLFLRAEQLTDLTATVAWRESLDLGNNWMEKLEEASQSDEKPGDGGSWIRISYEEYLQAAIKCRYVIVYKTLSYETASVTGEKTFDPGKAELAVWLFDREASAQQPVCSFKINVRPSTSVHVTYDKHNAIETGLQSKLYGNIVEKARSTVFEKLREKTGAKIKEL